MGNKNVTLNWNDTLLLAQATFDTVFGVGNTLLSGGPLNGGVLGIEFIGAYADRNIAQFTLGANNLTPAGNVQFFTVYDGNSVYSVPVQNGTAVSVPVATTQNGNLGVYDALTSLPGGAISPATPDIVVTGGALPASPISVTFTGAFTGLAQSLLLVDNGSMLAGTTASVAITATPGAGTLPVTSILASAALSGSRGLAFSPLDVNLWHPTMRRNIDAGHGINTAPDSTRTPGNAGHDITAGMDTKSQSEATGGVSLYFGVEQSRTGNGTGAGNTNNNYFAYQSYGGQLGVLNTAWQDDLTSNPNIRNNFNVPGGAFGRLVTNSIDLSQWRAADRPTFYFTYFLDDGSPAGGAPRGSTTMRDSARVFASSDHGITWTLVATNNAALGAELPAFLADDSTYNGSPVQQLYPTANWRQARIDLSNWAGQADVRFRFDFSTAGKIGEAIDPTAAVLPSEKYGQFSAELSDNSLAAAERGQNNAHEGFYIDDLIVGFAERGELVTAATVTPPDTTGFSDMYSANFAKKRAEINNLGATAPSIITSGGYQFEIRRGTEYAAPPSKTSPALVIYQTFDTSDRLVSGQSSQVTPALENFDLSPDDDPFNMSLFVNGTGSVANWSKSNTHAQSLPSSFKSATVGAVGTYSSTMLADFDTGYGTISFNVMVDAALPTPHPPIPNVPSEDNAFQFFIDGVQQKIVVAGVTLPFQQLPGTGTMTPAFAPVSFPITAGTHTLEWRYYKGNSTIWQTDAAYIDDLVIPLPPTASRLGDQNVPREQGMVVIEGNFVRDVLNTGIIVEAGARDESNNFPYVGPVRVTPVLNNARLVTSTLIVNNVVTNFNLVGIRVSGDANPANQPVAAVPMTKIINNTIVGGSASFVSFVDFSSIPGGAPVEGLPITTQFAAGNGVSFLMSDGSLPLLCQVGDQIWGSNKTPSMFAFGMSPANDSLRSGQPNIGQFFLTDNTPGGSLAANNPALVITYTQPTAAAEALILDIDGGEAWTISAYAAGSVVPLLPPIVLNAGSVGAGSGKAAPWRFNRAVADISKITVQYTGAKALTGVGLGFANFYAYGGKGIGIDITGNASPTVVNNIVANTDTGIVIDASSAGLPSPPDVTTTLFQNNRIDGNNNGNTKFVGTNAIQALAEAPLFVSAGKGNYYLAASQTDNPNQAIDSSLNTRVARTLYTGVTNALGIPQQDMFAPTIDRFGQLRLDDPDTPNASGLGANIFIDRGAVERADFQGPVVQMVTPVNNDPAGVDKDPGATSIHFDPAAGSPPVTQFSIRFTDVGIGVDDTLANISSEYTLQQDGVLLIAGTDYVFSYNANTKQVNFTSVSTFPLDHVYTIAIDNSAASGIADLAGNPLSPNRSDGSTQFTILLGGHNVDYGDAPDSYGTTLANDGARHVLLPGNPLYSLYLGAGVDADPDGRPNATATGDDADYYVTAGTSGLTVVPKSPFVLQTPAASGLLGTETFTITDNLNISVTLTCKQDFASGGTNEIVYYTGDSADDVARRIVAGIANVTGLTGITAVDLNGGGVQINGAKSVTALPGATLQLANRLPAGLLIPAAYASPSLDGKTFTVADGVNAPVMFEFDNNHSTLKTTTAIEYNAADSNYTLAGKMAAAIAGALSNLTAVVTTVDLPNQIYQVDLTSKPLAGTTNVRDDEDGVVFGGAFNPDVNNQTLITVTASAAGFLDAWMDFNRDGLFSPTEQIFTSKPVVAGANALQTTTPNNALLGTTYARFRLSTTGGLGPTGQAIGGEVEDYAVQVVNTIAPTNHPPQIDLTTVTTTPAGLTILEDSTVGLTFSNIVVSDIDDRDDPRDIELQVTVAVQHGFLTLATTNGLTLSADENGDGVPDLDVNGDGLINAADIVDGTSDRAIVMTGTIAALNAALQGLHYQSVPDYNTFVDPQKAPELLSIHVNDLGNTDKDTGIPGPRNVKAMFASATLSITVQPKNDRPVITVPSGLVRTVAEDLATGLLVVDGLGNGIRVDDPDALYDPRAIELQVTLDVLHGGLRLGDTTGLTLATPPVPALQLPTDTAEPRVSGTFQKLEYRGTIAALNAALKTLRYYGDADFNTSTLSERLIVHVNDLGYTDVATPIGSEGAAVGTRLMADQTIVLTVSPTNDAPVITLPTNPPSTLNEDQVGGLLLTNGSGLGLQVSDVDSINNPAIIQLQVTVGVLHGGLQLGTAANLTYDQLVPVLSPPGDAVAPSVPPLAPGTYYQQLVFHGTIVDLNTALKTLRYFGDADYNSLRGNEVLQVSVNDLGNTGGTALTTTAAWPLTINAVNDPPVLVLPAGQALDEDSSLVFSAATTNALTVSDVDLDVLETPAGQLRVRLSVSHGTFTLPDSVGLTFSLVDQNGDGISDFAIPDNIPLVQLEMSGRPIDINAALDGMLYHGNLNFNGTEQMIVTASDLGNTGIGGAKTVNGTLTITVRPVNDPPVVTIPAVLFTGTEDTNLAIYVATNGLPNRGIVVGDPNDGPDAAVILEVTLQAIHGTLTVNTTVSSGIAIASGNGTGTVTLSGTASRLNATLASPTGVIYRGNQDYNNYSLDHDPNPNENIIVTVNDRANGGTGGALHTSATMTISVTPVNDPPRILSPGPLVLNEEAANVFIPLIVQDVDADENPIFPVGNPTPVTLLLTMTDTAGNRLTGQHLRVDNSVVGGTVLGNDTEQVTIHGSPAAITDALGTNGLHYLPAANFNGRLQLVAVVNDHGNTGGTTDLTYTVTIPITVNAVNDSPVAGNDSFTTAEDVRLTVAATTLLSNDIPGPPDEILAGQVVRIVPSGFGQPGHGMITYDGTNIVYQPQANFNGLDTFTYMIDDGDPASIGVGTVTVTVTPVNDPPVAVNDSVTTAEDTVLTVAVSTLTANDSPGPANEGGLGQGLRIAAGGVGIPQHGTVSCDGVNVVYTPQADYFGTDTFTYTLSDDGVPSLTATGTVTVTVTAVNDPPVAGNDSLTTAEGIAVTVPVAALLFNDRAGPSNESGQTVRIVAMQFVSAYGSVTYNSTQVTYTPNANFHGVDQFTYTIDDGDLLSTALGTVTVTVVGVNKPPTASDDSVSTNEDTAVTVAVTTLLSNDSPGPVNDVPSGQTVQFLPTLLGTPLHGTLVYDGGANKVIYTPQADFNGTDKFTYAINDGDPAFTAVGTVTITVVAVNDPPVAVGDAVTTAEDTAVTVPIATLLSNDSPGPANESSQTLRIVANGFGLPAHGTVAYDPANQQVRYTPEQDFNGTDKFTYKIDDGDPASFAFGTVTVTVTPVNDPPSAGNDFLTTAEDTPLSMTASLLSNDSPGPVNEASQVLRIVAGGFSTPSHGTVTFNAGQVVYTPSPNFHAIDSFTYTISDDGVPALTAVGTVTITVTAVNDPPTAGSDAISTAKDTAVTMTVATLLSNDIPGPPDEVQAGQAVRLVPNQFGPALHGTVAFDALSQTVVYTPQSGFLGTDSFTYMIDDGNLASTAVGTVNVTVTAVASAVPWQNPVNRFDANGDGQVTPLDVLSVINLINTFGSGPISGTRLGLAYPDVFGDNEVTASDVLALITQLNALSAGGSAGEGEASMLGVSAGPSAAVSPAATFAAGAAGYVTIPGVAPAGGPILAQLVDRDVMTAIPVLKHQPSPLLAERWDSGVATVPGTQQAAASPSIYEASAIDGWGLEDALADIAGDLDSAAREEATDSLFASLGA
ncbi:MAG: Ig-like domain-containing protein [Planctomycetota bacterium]|nr:Ig-like domain-containing protein [Planctomycetota bacterium]